MPQPKRKPKTLTADATFDLATATIQLEAAAREVAAALKACSPYLADGAEKPLPTWGPHHFGLLLATLTSGRDGETVERWMTEQPALLNALAATLVRFGYALAEESGGIDDRT